MLFEFQVLRDYVPRASVFPAVWDMRASACPYMWPYCKQALYAGAMGHIANATVLNGLGVVGRLVGDIRVAAFGTAPDCIQLQVSHKQVLWPWAGHLAILVTVSKHCSSRSGWAGANVTVTVESPARYR